MPNAITRRRTFGAAAAIALAAPFIHRAAAAAPIQLRCSLDTAPSHPRNVAFRDFLAKVEAASDGQITTKLFESGALFPDLQVLKAVVQGQVEMACPGTWTITGFVADADFSELPAFYGRPIDLVRKATDGKAGTNVNTEIKNKLHVQVLGGWFDLGFYNWFSTRKPLNSLDDIKNMKIRSPGGVLISWRIHYLGGIPNVTARGPTCRWRCRRASFDGLDQLEQKAATAPSCMIPACATRCRTIRASGCTCRSSTRRSGRRLGRSCRTPCCSYGPRTCPPIAPTPRSRKSTPARN